MITIKTNIREVAKAISDRIAKTTDPNFLRPVALAMITPMKIRIHTDGNASDGAQIGTYSKGYIDGLRKKYNRGKSKKVIASLTRQMEKDYAAVATKAGYGIGFHNDFNFDKMQFVQETYGKKISDLTTEERRTAEELIEDLVNKTLQS